SPSHPPKGCPFHTRCPVAEPRCAEMKPAHVEVSEDHYAACVLLNDGGMTK
ncbi:oligopeptide/dipeptide ABC transporter ATP-binding protein, partial [Staphylococcus aureus]